MDQPHSQRIPPTPEFLVHFQKALGSRPALPYDEFIDLALFHPEIGYYRRKRTRVGSSNRTDFYTSVSLGSLFGELLIEAITQILPHDPKSFHLIEIGAEPDKGTFSDLKIPFADYQILRLGELLIIPSNAIVFANEWLDAQPFRRFLRTPSGWTELGVQLTSSGTLDEIKLEPPQTPPFSSKLTEQNPGKNPPEDHPFPFPLSSFIPPNTPYRYDFPSGAISALSQIAEQSWNGLFLTADYGLDAETLFRYRPQGTARTYSQHRMGTDLLSNPSQCDITCHLNWDDLETCLASFGFSNIQLDRQESFLISKAPQTLAGIIHESAQSLSARKQALQELIHPQNMGSKFQFLYASRF